MNWTVAVTWPMYERRVERALARCGHFDFYVPKCKTPKKRTALLFPRYVFVAPAEEWMEIRNIWGVSKLLRSGDKPAIVEESTLTALRAREKNGFVVLPQHHVARLRIGQRVRITIGVFAGMKGTYRGRTTKRWERVDLPSFGQVVLATGNLVAE